MTELEYNNCVVTYSDRIYRFVLKNLKNVADSEDIVQSVFELLWKKRKEITTDNPKSLLFTMAYRKMIDLIRKKEKISLPGEMTNFEKGHEMKTSNNLKEALNRALDSLDRTKRALVLLKDYEGYSYQEIAKITTLSESQVKVYLHRARVHLRDYLVKIENLI